MKNLICIICLFLIILCHGVSRGQATASLKVGDNAPNLSITKWVKGTPVTEWRKGKIYVIEFGATWCSPCAAAIPELTALQKKYQADLVVASIFVKERNLQSHDTKNPAYVTNVENYVHRKSEKMQYTIGVDMPTKQTDNDWLAAAGLQGIPHVFVIDKTGEIAWIGGNLITAEAVVKSIIKKEYDLAKNVEAAATKAEQKVKYDPEKLLLIANNGGDESDFIFRSILTRFHGDISKNNPDAIQSFHGRKPDAEFDNYKDKLELIGAPIGQFYYLAYTDTLANVIQTRNFIYEYPDTLKSPWQRRSYGKGWHEPILEVADKKPFQFNWNNTTHRFNYSLKVPKGTGSAAYLQSILQHDLQSYFGFEATAEIREMPYWKLSAPNKELALAKLKSKDQSRKLKIIDNQDPFVLENAEMRDIIMLLGTNFGYGSYDYGRLPLNQQAAFIDQTGITDKIDFVWDNNLTFEQIKKFLSSLGLELSRAYKPMKVVVIRDATHPSSK